MSALPTVTLSKTQHHYALAEHISGAFLVLGESGFQSGQKQLFLWLLSYIPSSVVRNRSHFITLKNTTSTTCQGKKQTNFSLGTSTYLLTFCHIKNGERIWWRPRCHAKKDTVTVARNSRVRDSHFFFHRKTRKTWRIICILSMDWLGNKFAGA